MAFLWNIHFLYTIKRKTVIRTIQKRADVTMMRKRQAPNTIANA